MRPIGGEIEVKKDGYNQLLTDSGRSSFRLFIRSGYKGKQFLIPDYLCKEIEKILIEEQINYNFYHVNNDLSIDIDSVNSQSFDVLFVVNYFGGLQDLSKIKINEKILVEDNVFLFDFDNRYSHPAWFGFNSYRKVTKLADGSLAKSNLPMNLNLIEREQSLYAQKKYIAKDKKYKFVNNSLGTEEDYLADFEEGESILNSQKSIFQMSPNSILLLSEYDIALEQRIRKDRYQRVFKSLKDVCINLNPSYYSFIVLKVKDNQLFQRRLSKMNIFLPIHWPRASKQNPLYDSLISIPLFENYLDTEFVEMFELIKKNLP